MSGWNNQWTIVGRPEFGKDETIRIGIDLPRYNIHQRHSVRGSMYLSRAASAVSFFAALGIGIAAAYVVSPWGGLADVGPVHNEPIVIRSVSCPHAIKAPPVRAEDLRGRWTGTWGYDDDPSTIDIDRVEGNKFYGTLSEYGAQIAIEGTVDRDARKVTFRETKVLKLGPEMTEWSLGNDNGIFSADGLSLIGSGTDKWGTYGWEMEKSER